MREQTKGKAVELSKTSGRSTHRRELLPLWAVPSQPPGIAAFFRSSGLMPQETRCRQACAERTPQVPQEVFWSLAFGLEE